MHMVTLGLVTAGIAACESDVLCRFPENECTCELCVDACKSAPCWGTPQEMDALIRAGYGKRLMMFVLPEGSFTKTPERDFEQRVEVLAPAMTNKGKRLKCGLRPHTGGSLTVSASSFGRCTFLNDKGLCEIHDLDMKPIEGRVEHHEIGYDEAIAIRRKIFETWNTPYGKEIVDRWTKEYFR